MLQNSEEHSLCKYGGFLPWYSIVTSACVSMEGPAKLQLTTSEKWPEKYMFGIEKSCHISGHLLYLPTWGVGRDGGTTPVAYPSV